MAEPTTLQEIVGVRKLFRGTFSRFGWYSRKVNNREHIIDIVLLINITDENGNYLKERLTFNLTKGFQELDLTRGDILSFTATVGPYTRKRYVPYPEGKLQASEKN